MSDCGAEDVICFQGLCMTEIELAERFDFWELNSMCQGTCANCKSNEIQSLMSTGRNQEYRLCADCMSDSDCKEGTWCIVGKCLSDVGSPVIEVANKEPLVEEETASAIVGYWDYGGFHYYFSEDGSIIEEELEITKGTWEYVSGNDYIIYWDNRYSYIDDLTLSANGNLLEGIRRVREESVKLTRME